MERNAKSAEARSQFPMAYLLPEINIYNNAIIHYQYFHQYNTEFINTLLPRHQIYCYSSIEQLHLINVAISQNEYGYEFSFRGDNSIPYMRGHNKDYYNIQSRYYGKDCLNEIAFTLKQKQYGRIIWNTRSIEFDTGDWYYNIHIYNFYVVDELPQSNIFVSHIPHFVYKKMSMLYRH